MIDRIDTDLLVTIAPSDPAVTRPLPAEAPAPEPDEHETRRLSPLTLGQQLDVQLRIAADRLHRGTPWFAAGAAIVVGAVVLLLLLPTPAARALVLARPTAPAVYVTATPALAEALPTAEPIIVEAAPPPMSVALPTAEPAPVELQPALVIVAQAPEPTPPELQPIIVPAGDGGQWSIVQFPGGVSDATYLPAPGVPPLPTPHYGAFGGGGGSWDN
jgi:hypothetical protein